jgi:prepilin-type N-terminal cleavage/methylation domain-containing protein
MRDESGFTIIELLVSLAISLVVITMVTTMITVTTHNEDRIARRVDASQRGRPVMARIVNELHSACVAPRIIPVIADGTANGSTATQISFLSQSGEAVTPTPDKHVITLSGTTMSESVYPATGGAAPTWTFSGTPSSTTQLLANVSAPGGVMFSYYRFLNGQLSNTPLPVPLSASNAALTAYVTVSLTASPTGGKSLLDANSPITFSNSADLRLESASQVPSQDNQPCT